MNRAVRWALLSVGVAGMVATGTMAPGAATPPSGLTNVLLARGTDVSHHGALRLQLGTDVAMAKITVDPGGASGWHSHPGGAVIVVAEGALTVYSASDDDCRIRTYSAGQAFIERPGEVDDVLNNGSVPYVLYVTFPGVPAGGSPRTDESDPGTCPGI